MYKGQKTKTIDHHLWWKGLASAAVFIAGYVVANKLLHLESGAYGVDIAVGALASVIYLLSFSIQKLAAVAPETEGCPPPVEVVLAPDTKVHLRITKETSVIAYFEGGVVGSAGEILSPGCYVIASLYDSPGSFSARDRLIIERAGRYVVGIRPADAGSEVREIMISAN